MTGKGDGQRMSVKLWQLLAVSELCPCKPVPRLEKHSKMKVADQKRLPGITEHVTTNKKHRLKIATGRTRAEPVPPAPKFKDSLENLLIYDITIKLTIGGTFQENRHSAAI